jgi:hypothetical protein
MILSIVVNLALIASVGANVMGIDFGSDNMKVGLVSPGKFDIGMSYKHIHHTLLI